MDGAHSVGSVPAFRRSVTIGRMATVRAHRRKLTEELLSRPIAKTVELARFDFR